MSDNAVSYFFTDWYSYSVPLQIILQNIHNIKTIGIRFSIPIYILKVTVFLQRFRKFHIINNPIYTFLRVEERPQMMWPMLITFFFLLIFSQLKLFFHPLCSFSYENHALWIFFSFLADMSSSWVCTSSALKNIIFIITNNSPKSSYFGRFFHKHKLTNINKYPRWFQHIQVIHPCHCK